MLPPDADITSSAPQPVRFRPTAAFIWWLVASSALIAVGWLKSINLVLLLAYLLIVLGGVNAWAARRMVRRVSVSRSRHWPIFARELVSQSLDLRNDSDRPAVISIGETVDGRHRSWFVPSLGPGVHTPLTKLASFDRRGRKHGSVVEAVSGYPFGLLQWRREVCPATEWVVLPAVGVIDLPHLRRWLLRQGSGEGRVPRAVARQVPADGDLRGLRPYRRGDSPRDIHWRSSARRGQLYVREYDIASPLDLMIIIDPWRPMVDEPGDIGGAAEMRLEWALSLATSVAWAWGHADVPGGLTLVIPGRRPVVASGVCSPGFVRQAFAVLADLDGTTETLHLPTVARRSARRTLRWLVSSRVGGPVAGALRDSGVPVAISDPHLRPVWYTPPIGLDLPGADRA